MSFYLNCLPGIYSLWLEGKSSASISTTITSTGALSCRALRIINADH